MRKIALVFVLAVLLPSLVLAWLAARSLRDQQFALERQQSLLYQGVVDSLAKDAANHLNERQHEFARQVQALSANEDPANLNANFDERLRKSWPLAQVGFVVALEGKVVAPSLFGRPEARRFRMENDRFLCNNESVEVYFNNAKVSSPADSFGPSGANGQKNYVNSTLQALDVVSQSWKSTNGNAQNTAPEQSAYPVGNGNQLAIKRNVTPQQRAQLPQNQLDSEDNQASKLAPAETEFRQLVGDASEGTVARFLQNQLQVMFWCRSSKDPQLIYGAQIDLEQLRAGMRGLAKLDDVLAKEIGVALLDDSARPVAAFPAGLGVNWRRPFVAAEIGEGLPHWEMAAYLLDPVQLTKAAVTLKYSLSLLIALLVLAIAFGGWLIARDLRRELFLARQKTDFVSNVSHELKTPLTSIRMFSELLAEGRVSDPEKQKSYLRIITAETGRLSRLINNVLDFSRMERGEKKYEFKRCDLALLAGETAANYRPHLESAGFTFHFSAPETPVWIEGDCDSLAQILVNLISNAEKYCDGKKEISVELKQLDIPVKHAEVRVMDRGLGVPKGTEIKIFEQFYRAHDSLGSGIQGSGLGLTLARQIARAHGGEVTYEPREGGGSCFILSLPLEKA